MRIDLTKMQVGAVALMLRESLMDDEQLYLDTLEGETDLYEIVRNLLDQIEQDEGVQKALTDQIADRNARKERATNRIRAHREAIAALLECAGLDRLALPEATVSVRKVAPKAIVTNEEALPDSYCTFSRKPNLMQIRADFGEDGVNIPGVSLDNGGTSLTVRRK